MKSPETSETRINDINAILDERGVVETQFNNDNYRLRRADETNRCAFMLTRGGHFDLDKRYNPKTGKSERYFTPPDLFIELDENMQLLRVQPVKPEAAQSAAYDQEVILAIVDKMIHETAVW